MSTGDGWIKLHRCLLDWEWYDDANTIRVFLHCLLKANTERKTWRGIVIERGQFFTSIGGLAGELRLSDKQIRTSLDKLISGGSLASQGASNGTMITVCKYGSYQEKNDTKGEQTANETANEGQTEGEQRANEGRQHKNNKNKRIKEDIIYPPAVLELVEFSKPFFDAKYLNGAAHETFDKLLRLDNYPSEKIKKAIELGRKDHFWGKNFLSPAKLREKNKSGVMYADVFLELKSTPVQASLSNFIPVSKVDTNDPNRLKFNR